MVCITKHYKLGFKQTCVEKITPGVGCRVIFSDQNFWERKDHVIPEIMENNIVGTE